MGIGTSSALTEVDVMHAFNFVGNDMIFEVGSKLLKFSVHKHDHKQ